VQINRQSVVVLFVAGSFSLLATGCGSSYSLGTVTGTVTLDGKPLPQATVTFSRGQGRMSVGTTDEDGRYQLQYSARQKGAEPGSHKVRIATQIEAVSGEGDLAAVQGRKELLPPRYNDKTELTAEVKPGRNTIDFDLTSAAK
jgi:hypothetical protein